MDFDCFITCQVKEGEAPDEAPSPDTTSEFVDEQWLVLHWDARSADESSSFGNHNLFRIP